MISKQCNLTYIRTTLHWHKNVPKSGCKLNFRRLKENDVIRGVLLEKYRLSETLFPAFSAKVCHLTDSVCLEILLIFFRSREATLTPPPPSQEKLSATGGLSRIHFVSLLHVLQLRAKFQDYIEIHILTSQGP